MIADIITFEKGSVWSSQCGSVTFFKLLTRFYFAAQWKNRIAENKFYAIIPYSGNPLLTGH
jgi:hypothetical protein